MRTQQSRVADGSGKAAGQGVAHLLVVLLGIRVVGDRLDLRHHAAAHLGV